jgi:hypothetical protein
MNGNMTGKDVERNSHNLVWDNFLEFAWREWEKSWKPSKILPSVLDMIQTGISWTKVKLDPTCWLICRIQGPYSGGNEELYSSPMEVYQYFKGVMRSSIVVHWKYISILKG